MEQKTEQRSEEIVKKPAEAPASEQAPESSTPLEKIKNLLGAVRDRMIQIFDSIFLPEGLTSELERKILNRIDQKMRQEKSKYGFIPVEHRALIIDQCIKESLRETMPQHPNFRLIYSYFWQHFTD